MIWEIPSNPKDEMTLLQTSVEIEGILTAVIAGD
jgi:hypothetical protein